MATSVRAPRALSNGLSAALKPRYVCRTCRHQILHELQQIRPNSSLSPRQIIRRSSSYSTEQRRHISLGSFVGRSEQPKEPELVEEDGLPLEEYTEATTWDGLEHLGHEGHWRDLPPDPKDNYAPWLDPTSAAPPQREQFLSLLWISIVECLALKLLRKDPKSIHTNGPPSFRGGMNTLKIRTSSAGTVSHLEDPQETLDTTKASQKPDGEVEFSVPEIEQQLQGARFDFRDPITFTILKRFSVLTGHRVPDPVLNTVIRGNKPLTEFIDLLTQTAKPKPKKFAEVLLAKQKKALDFAARDKLLLDEGLNAKQTAVVGDEQAAVQSKKHKPKFQPLGPNVMILPRRETKVDREMEIGRWKVIKKELETRGLPVYPIPRLVPAGESWRKDEVEEIEKDVHGS